MYRRTTKHPYAIPVRLIQSLQCQRNDLPSTPDLLSRRVISPHNNYDLVDRIIDRVVLAILVDVNAGVTLARRFDRSDGFKCRCLVGSTINIWSVDSTLAVANRAAPLGESRAAFVVFVWVDLSDGGIAVVVVREWSVWLDWVAPVKDVR